MSAVTNPPPEAKRQKSDGVAAAASSHRVPLPVPAPRVDHLMMEGTRIKHLFPILGTALTFATSHSVKKLNLTEFDLKDADLLAISKVTHLDELHLNCQNVTEEGLRHLLNLRKLDTLVLVGRSLKRSEILLFTQLPYLAHIQLDSVIDNDTTWVYEFKFLNTLDLFKGTVPEDVKMFLEKRAK